MKTDDWHGLYRAGWKGLIVDEAFSHPAKFARNLIRRIYKHCMAEDWLHEGDTVVDPFGGVALGGLDAMRLGLNWIGIELEPKFVALGEQNIVLWNLRYASKLPKWGSARLLQGDSRRLLETIARADGIVSSPPYAGIGAIDLSPHDIEIMKANEASGKSTRKQNNSRAAIERQIKKSQPKYGDTPGQLAALREGDFDAAISSPPYAAGAQHTGGDDLHQEHIRGGPLRFVDYGDTPGQLAALREGNLDAAISSPPWEESLDRGTVNAKERRFIARQNCISNAAHISPIDMEKVGLRSQPDYGSSAGQLGSESGDTFWSAARLIVAQTFAALRPGGHAVWVVKAFVQDGRRVDFPDQWRRLCESVGFVTLHEHRCWLIEDRGTQLAMDGNHQHHRTERKSFFRRLAERKGSPRIDYEIVWCMEKP